MQNKRTTKTIIKTCFFNNTQETWIKFRHEVNMLKELRFLQSFSDHNKLEGLMLVISTWFLNWCFSKQILKINLNLIVFINYYHLQDHHRHCFFSMSEPEVWSYSQGNGFTLLKIRVNNLFCHFYVSILWFKLHTLPGKLILRFWSLNSCTNNNYLLFKVQGGQGGEGWIWDECIPHQGAISITMY